MELVRDKTIKDTLMNRTVQNMFDRGELRKDHPLQRKPGRWNKSDKDGLIATVIKDEDIDSVKICEQLTPNGVTLWLIDGLQRLTTLSSYRNGVFKIGNNVELPIIQYQKAKRDEKENILKDEYGSYIYEIVDYDLRGKGYNDLPVELKEKFDNYKIDVVKHLNCTDEEIGYHIRRYNKQKSMNPSENAVTYMDNMAKEVKRISINNRFFKDCGTYKESDRNNGTIDRIIIETVMCMFHLDNWKKSGKAMGTFINENSSKEEFNKLDNNLHRLEKIITENLKDIFTNKDTFIWLTLFNKFTELGIEDCNFAEFLSAFKNELYQKDVNGELFYEIDKEGSTKDKSIIVRKLNLLEHLMYEFLHINKEDLVEVDYFEFIKENVDSEVTEEDIELYEMVGNDKSEAIDNVESWLLSDKNRPSWIAFIGYVMSKDEEDIIEEWLPAYEKNNKFILNQKKAFLHMKADFENYLKAKKVA